MICIAKEWFFIKIILQHHQFIIGDIQHCGMPNAINRMKRTTTKFSTAQQQTKNIKITKT